MKSIFDDKIDKQDLYLLKQHSAIDQDQLQEITNKESYAGLGDWKRFIKYFILLMGSGLLISGIVFFFAYNWNDLPAFAKFAIVLLLIGVCVVVSVTNRLSSLLRKVGLLSASVLIGVLMAVFGQVYQTGANAYDLFLSWTVAITAWTLVSKSSMQWLFQIFLVNLTIYLYLDQVIVDYSFFSVMALVLVINVVLFGLPYWLSRYQNYTIAEYYKGVMALFCSAIAVFIISARIFVSNNADADELNGQVIGILLSIVWLVGCYLISLKNKDIILFSYTGLSVATIGLMFLIRAFEIDGLAFLLYAIYVLAVTFGLIKLIMNKHKRWNHEAE
ncbi:DUF2157 domain-containing protein [Myroides pelagicus]|uniref:DUF2157 domain-containing protein n=1 Tax=Myroides pelagicus TaxID=270914 RepID=UPI002DBE62D5|nr:DUF2157 domain-containing protein [Myroides pelagicus]MEC4114789.1 DUF2157 domain-containing protein [Myroides pelagicus]